MLGSSSLRFPCVPGHRIDSGAVQGRIKSVGTAFPVKLHRQWHNTRARIASENEFEPQRTVCRSKPLSGEHCQLRSEKYQTAHRFKLERKPPRTRPSHQNKGTEQIGHETIPPYSPTQGKPNPTRTRCGGERRSQETAVLMPVPAQAKRQGAAGRRGRQTRPNCQ